MAGISTKFTVQTAEYRPCKVNGVKAIFHRWSDKDDVYIQTMCKYRHQDLIRKLREQIERDRIAAVGETIVKIRKTVAIVEFQDGRIREVEPETIEFCDTGFLIEEDSALRVVFYEDENDDSKKDI